MKTAELWNDRGHGNNSRVGFHVCPRQDVRLPCNTAFSYNGTLAFT